MDKREPQSNVNSPEYKEFLKLLQFNKKRIFGFILSAVPRYSIAEDIMQDTIIRLWTKFPSFEPGTNFAAWGIAVARFVVLEHQKKDKGNFIHFNSQALENLSEPFELFEDLDDRVEALRNCLKKLPEKQREMIQMHYAQKLSIKGIALQIGRPIHGMYKAMTKIHYALQECIERALKRWDTA